MAHDAVDGAGQEVPLREVPGKRQDERDGDGAAQPSPEHDVQVRGQQARTR